MIDAAKRLWKRLLSDRGGQTAIALALLALPMIVAMGGSVDYTLAAARRSGLQAATDAAALAASKVAADYIATNGWSTTNAATAASLGNVAAKTAFAANISSSDTDATSVTPTMTISSAQSINSYVTAGETYTTTFLGIIGASTFDLTATASATASLPVAYYQFVFLIDISGSMAIGGTSSDIATLQASSKFGYCGFACHDPYHYYSSTDYRALAKTKGISLKIDYVNTATQTFLSSLNTALTAAGAGSKTSIYTFGTNFTTVLSGSTSMSTAISKAATIDVEAVGKSSTNWGYTKTATALTSVKNLLTNVGDGTTSTSRKTYVVFITDGLEDLPASGTTYGRSTDVAYGTACTAIKNTGATLITIEATYPVVPNDAQYTQIVAPYASLLAPTLKSCATSASWYFSADDGPAIEAAMNTAVVQITKTLRLAN